MESLNHKWLAKALAFCDSFDYSTPDVHECRAVQVCDCVRTCAT